MVNVSTPFTSGVIMTSHVKLPGGTEKLSVPDSEYPVSHAVFTRPVLFGCEYMRNGLKYISEREYPPVEFHAPFTVTGAAPFTLSEKSMIEAEPLPETLE